MERFTLFWDGPFSQWTTAYFTIEGVEYSCAEQHMMAMKARFFEDLDTLSLIMEAESPSTQKRLGRLVEGFDADRWEEEEDNGMPRCWNVVFQGNRAKFTQNPELLELLLDTAGTTLVEASPDDIIWGIGLSEEDPRAHDRSEWRGSNWLGEVLTELRDELSMPDARRA
ncbi:MAG: ribA/ribD-fused uncharacterized protein [Myxococcota bacterium]|jgi:ribA/ribD-fused uncharacterized protein